MYTTGAMLPLYRCHKKVRALKIETVHRTLDGGTLIPEDYSYDPCYVSQEYLEKHQPHAGGYFVVYNDGYQSFSPAATFEAGYTLV